MLLRGTDTCLKGWSVARLKFGASEQQVKQLMTALVLAEDYLKNRRGLAVIPIRAACKIGGRHCVQKHLS